MRYLVVMLMCCLPVMVEAKEIDEYLWIDHGNGMVATCNDTLTKCWTECELKMKEAMQEIDEILRLNHGLLMDRDPGQPRMCLNLSQHAYRQWDRVMKECVR